MAPTLGGGTQDTEFNKGFTKGFFTKNIRRRNGGGQGDSDPLMRSKVSHTAKKENEKIQHQESEPLIFSNFPGASLSFPLVSLFKTPQESEPLSFLQMFLLS